MNREALVPFYRAGTIRKIKAFPSLKVRSSEAANFLLQHFSVVNSTDDVLFRVAAQDIVKSCPYGFTSEKMEIEFPYIDAESRRPHAPRLPVIIIGCEKNIGKAGADFKKAAEEERPSTYDQTLWLGDFNPRLLDFEKRERALIQSFGLPIGVVDKKNSVFIVTDHGVEAKITQALNAFKL